ncbi:CPBP family intramembrane metalloprotease [bacterium]|nr:CPBP family intramembrane metalloprotease [bacterium]
MSERDGRKKGEVVIALIGLVWFRFRHMTGWLGKVYPSHREPTRPRHTKGSAFFLLMGSLFLVQGFFLTHQMIKAYAERSLSLRENAVALNDFRYSSLLSKSVNWPGMTDEEIRNDVEALIRFSEFDREDIGLAPLTAGEVVRQYREAGLSGFVNYEAFSKGKVTLRDFEGGNRVRLSRLLGMIFLGLLVALLFMPMAIRQKNLAATSDHQEWLFSLPIKESELLAGTFLSSVLNRPLAYLILWPLLTNLLIASGEFVLVAAIMGIVLTLLISVAITGLEIFLDTWIRARAPAILLKNAQMIFSMLGLLAFYAVLAACFAGSSSFPWVNWLAQRFPGRLGGPVGEVMLSGIAGLTGVGVVAALFFGLGGCTLAGRFMKTGWLSGNSQHSANRGLGDKSLRGGSLLKFEGLLLLRDRTLAMQVILVPIMIVGYQVLINPTMVQSITAAGICALAYSCGTYASLMTAPQLLVSEARGVWMIYNLPVAVAAYFRRRETLWRSVSTGLAVILVVVMILVSGDFQVTEIWRYLMTLLGVWVMGRVVSGIVLGKPQMPDVASGEMPRLAPGRMYGAMFFAGIFGALLWQGMFWPLVSSLVVFWFLGVAIWQRREISFNYLMEPVEEEPPSWGVDDGLWSVVVFLVAQVIVTVIGSLSGGVSGGLILVSFVVGGSVAFGFARLRQRQKAIPLPDFPDDGDHVSGSRLALEILLAALLCLAAGIGWTLVLETGIFGGADGGPGSEWSPMGLILLAVVAAPILEELLFRGFMCRTMLGFWSKRNAIFGSALIFAIVHPGTSFPPVFLLGIGTAVLYFRSRSVVPGMILHALYNLGIVGWALWG